MQEFSGSDWIEVADGRSREINDVARGFVARRGKIERLKVIGTDWKNLESGKDLPEKPRRLPKLFLRNIDRDIDGGLFERFDQNSGLCAGASAESDQFNVCSKMRCDFRAMPIQNVDLGPGDVIFGQFANLLEQGRSARVVKVFARKSARLAGKTRDNI